MDDLISRRAAIDALAEQIMESALMDNPTTASTDIDSYRPIAELSLRDVPSAQPEHLVKKTGNLVKGLVNDCISRQAAKDALAKFVPYAICDESTESYTNGLTDAYNLICQLPSVQPQRWIPVSEALPEKPFGCLVTVMDTEPMTMEEFENLLPYFVGYDGEQWNDWEGYQCPFEVLAWMPLPEAYKEGAE